MQQAGQRENSAQQNQNEVIEYRYRPGLLLNAAFFAAALGGAYLEFHEASTNTKGLVIQRAIHLDVEAATWFLWGLFAFCVVMALLFGTLLFKSLLTGPTLTLNYDVLRFPASPLRGTMTEIPLAGIEAMEVRTENKNTFLAIWHANGYDVVLQDRFPGKAAFESFVSAMYERTPAL